MIHIPPSDVDLQKFYSEYPTAYAQCRTWRHGPEEPYTVHRPNGPKGIIEITRRCRCGRLVTRVYTADYQRIGALTRTVYPNHPRYLALPGAGGVDKATIAERAIMAEIEYVEQLAAARAPSKSTNQRKKAARSRAPRKPK